MLNYEITFVVDPVLSSDEIEATAQTYVDMLTEEGCSIVFKNSMGLKQLAYPIRKRTSGVYYCVEFEAESGTVVPKAELAFTRDERIMRFLTVRLDKFGVKYNQDKRDGKIGTKKREAKPEPATKAIKARSVGPGTPKVAETKAASPKVDTPKAAAPVAADAVATKPSQEEE